MKTAIEKENSRNKKPTQGKRRKTETQKEHSRSTEMGTGDRAEEGE